MTSSNLDFQIVKLFLTKKEYFVNFFEIVHFSDQILKNIVEQIKLFYTHSTNVFVDKESIQSILYKLYNDIIYNGIIDDIYNIEIDESLVKEVLAAIYNKNVMHNLQDKISFKMQTQDFSTIDDLKEIVINEEEPDSEEVFSSLALSDHIKDEVGYKWPLESLTAQLGLLPRSTTGLVVGRVEIGKTAFLTQSSLCFLNQDAVVLHLNNEDPIPKLMERYYIQHFQRPKDVIFKHLAKCEGRFTELYNGKLRILDTAECSLYRIDFLIKQTSADVCIIDQLDPITNDIDPSSLELLYKNIRKIGKRRKTRILAASQAPAGTSEFLTLEDIHNSKVGKQAALDYMVGIGGNPGMPTRRYFSLPKNKLTGSHATFVANFNPPIMWYGAL